MADEEMSDAPPLPDKGLSARALRRMNMNQAREAALKKRERDRNDKRELQEAKQQDALNGTTTNVEKYERMKNPKRKKKIPAPAEPAVSPALALAPLPAASAAAASSGSASSSSFGSAASSGSASSSSSGSTTASSSSAPPTVVDPERATPAAGASVPPPEDAHLLVQNALAAFTAIGPTAVNTTTTTTTTTLGSGAYSVGSVSATDADYTSVDANSVGSATDADDAAADDNSAGSVTDADDTNVDKDSTGSVTDADYTSVDANSVAVSNTDADDVGSDTEVADSDSTRRVSRDGNATDASSRSIRSTSSVPWIKYRTKRNNDSDASTEPFGAGSERSASSAASTVPFGGGSDASTIPYARLSDSDVPPEGAVPPAKVTNKKGRTISLATLKRRKNWNKRITARKKTSPPGGLRPFSSASDTTSVSTGAAGPEEKLKTPLILPDSDASSYSGTTTDAPRLRYAPRPDDKSSGTETRHPDSEVSEADSADPPSFFPRAGALAPIAETPAPDPLPPISFVDPRDDINLLRLLTDDQREQLLHRNVIRLHEGVLRFSGGAYSQEKYDALRARLEALQKQMQKAKQEIEACLQTKIQLRDCIAEHTTLMKRLEEARTNLEQWRANSDGWEKKANETDAARMQLQFDKDALTTRVQNIQKSESLLKTQKDGAIKVNEDLNAKLQRAVAFEQQQAQQIQQLQTQVASLSAERDALRAASTNTNTQVMSPTDMAQMQALQATIQQQRLTIQNVNAQIGLANAWAEEKNAWAEKKIALIARLEHEAKEGTALVRELRGQVEHLKPTVAALTLARQRVLQLEGGLGSEKRQVDETAEELGGDILNAKQQYDTIAKLRRDVSALQHKANTAEESLKKCRGEKRALKKRVTAAESKEEDCKEEKERIDFYRNKLDIQRDKTGKANARYNTADKERLQLRLDLDTANEEIKRLGILNNIRQESKDQQNAKAPIKVVSDAYKAPLGVTDVVVSTKHLQIRGLKHRPPLSVRFDVPHYSDLQSGNGVFRRKDAELVSILRKFSFHSMVQLWSFASGYVQQNWMKLPIQIYLSESLREQEDVPIDPPAALQLNRGENWFMNMFVASPTYMNNPKIARDPALFPAATRDYLYVAYDPNVTGDWATALRSIHADLVATRFFGMNGIGYRLWLIPLRWSLHRGRTSPILDRVAVFNQIFSDTERKRVDLSTHPQALRGSWQDPTADVRNDLETMKWQAYWYRVLMFHPNPQGLLEINPYAAKELIGRALQTLEGKTNPSARFPDKTKARELFATRFAVRQATLAPKGASAPMPRKFALALEPPPARNYNVPSDFNSNADDTNWDLNSQTNYTFGSTSDNESMGPSSTGSSNSGFSGGTSNKSGSSRSSNKSGSSGGTSNQSGSSRSGSSNSSSSRSRRSKRTTYSVNSGAPSSASSNSGMSIYNANSGATSSASSNSGMSISAIGGPQSDASALGLSELNAGGQGGPLLSSSKRNGRARTPSRGVSKSGRAPVGRLDPVTKRAIRRSPPSSSLNSNLPWKRADPDTASVATSSVSRPGKTWLPEAAFTESLAYELNVLPAAEIVEQWRDRMEAPPPDPDTFQLDVPLHAPPPDMSEIRRPPLPKYFHKGPPREDKPHSDVYTKVEIKQVAGWAAAVTAAAKAGQYYYNKWLGRVEEGDEEQAERPEEPEEPPPQHESKARPPPQRESSPRPESKARPPPQQESQRSRSEAGPQRTRYDYRETRRAFSELFPGRVHIQGAGVRRFLGNTPLQVQEPMTSLTPEQLTKLNEMPQPATILPEHITDAHMRRNGVRYTYVERGSYNLADERVGGRVLHRWRFFDTPRTGPVIHLAQIIEVDPRDVEAIFNRVPIGDFYARTPTVMAVYDWSDQLPRLTEDLPYLKTPLTNAAEFLREFYTSMDGLMAEPVTGTEMRTWGLEWRQSFRAFAKSVRQYYDVSQSVLARVWAGPLGQLSRGDQGLSYGPVVQAMVDYLSTPEAATVGLQAFMLYQGYSADLSKVAGPEMLIQWT